MQSVVNSVHAGQLGDYTWIIDEIMIEEAGSLTVASSYAKPFDTDNNEAGLQSETFTSELVDEFIQLVAYCAGTSFVPPKFEVIRGEMDDNSKRIIKRLRKRFLNMYNHANATNTSEGLDTIPVAPVFEPENEII